MANGNGLNTLEYVQKLEQAGIPRKQAEAQASVLYDLITSNLATKRDVEFIKRDIKELDVKIETVRAELKRDIEAVRKDIETVKAELKRDITELELKIKASQNTQTFQLIGAMAALIGIFKFLPIVLQ